MARLKVGLDIGYLNVRAIKVAVRGKQDYRIVDHAEVSRFDDMGARKPLSRALAELDSRLPLRGDVTVASSDLITMVRFEHNTPMPPDRIDRVLRLELSQHVGDENDIAGDAVAIPVGGDEIIHCCGLAQSPQVLALLQELKGDGIKPRRVQLAAGAGANARLLTRPESDTGCRLLVDIGSRSIRVNLLRDGDFLACRQLPFGGDRFTEALAKAYQLRFDQAEQCKCGHQPMPQRPGEAPDENAETFVGLDETAVDEGTTTVGESEERKRASTPDWQRNSSGFQLEEPEIAEPGHNTVDLGVAVLGPEMRAVAEELYVQLGKTLSWFKAQLRSADIELSQIDLAGGGGNLDGLAPYLEQRFGTPVRLASPFQALEGKVPEQQHEYLLSFGLALSALPEAVCFDLTPESVQKRRLFWSQVLWPRVAAALLLAAGAVGGFALWQQHDYQRERLARYEAQKQQYQELKGQYDELRARHDGLLKDLQGIGARIFGGRDLLYLIRALKQEAPAELWITKLSTMEEEIPEQSQIGGRGRGRSRRPQSGSTQSSRQKDTAIDHGSVFVVGKIKPDDADFATLHGHFIDWFHDVRDWTIPGSQTRLFAAGEELRIDLQAGTARRPNKEVPFEVRFDFQPTTLDEVLSGALSDDDEE